MVEWLLRLIVVELGEVSINLSIFEGRCLFDKKSSENYVDNIVVGVYGKDL